MELVQSFSKLFFYYNYFQFPCISYVVIFNFPLLKYPDPQPWFGIVLISTSVAEPELLGAKNVWLEPESNQTDLRAEADLNTGPFTEVNKNRYKKEIFSAERQE